MAMPPQKYDVVVIGAGIVGLATALVLSRRFKNKKIAIIESEDGPARHQTGNNSGVIHSGLYYRPGSLKALNCLRGRESMYRFCREYGISHEQCGKLVVAVNDQEVIRLQTLHERGLANGLKGLRWLEGKEINFYEPHVRGKAALLVPETGIVDYKQVADTMLHLLEEAGAAIFFNHRFLNLRRMNEGLILETNQNGMLSRTLINCGGLHSDRIARRCGLRPDLKIVPFRGEYYKLKKEKKNLVKNLIYPVPDPAFPFLGVHFTRMIDNNVEAGPNAVLALKREGYRRSSFSLRDTLEVICFPGFWKLAGKYMGTGLAEYYRSFSKGAFTRALQHLIPEIGRNDLEPGGAGVRAQALTRDGMLVDDFHILRDKDMIHVLNAPSPAATASLSIGESIADMAAEQFSW